MSYLHGVETIIITTGNRTIRAVPSSIMVLIGIAPIGPIQTLTLVTSVSEAAQFGARVPGFNIPEALDSIFSQGAGIVVVINTFDATANTTAVASEVAVITDGKFKLAFAPVGTVPVVKDTATGNITYTAGTQYTIDAWGNGTVIDTTAISAGSVTVTYKKLNPASVNTAQIIGTIAVDGTTRTGCKLIENIPTVFGFKPKIILCPGYSAIPGVSAELLVQANKFRGIVPMDAPEGTTYTQALAARGSAGTIGWNNSNPRSILLFPKWHKASPDPRAAVGATVLEWYSSLFAGVISAVDYNLGYWFSPSNKPIAGVIKPEVVITCSMTDSTAQNQLLNAAGIVTYNVDGGLNTYGNNSAMYPYDSNVTNFICVQRTRDIIDESIETASKPYVDQPLTSGSIDSIRGDVNEFMQSLVQKGALIDGTCQFIAADNPVSELSQGNVNFFNDFMSPVPMQRVTFKSHVNSSLLSKLLAK